MTSLIALPDEGAGLQVVASVSGGKDSTALILALIEAGISARYVFADTGWEAVETYEYLDYLRTRLQIEIDVVGVPGGMVERVRSRAGFPGRMQRWCTRELKIEPLREYHDRVIEETGVETVSAMGIRADESESRSKMGEWEDEPEGPRKWGGFLWRPLLRWSIEDVLMIHRRHEVNVNPLYQRGHNRVGCYPCIYSSKEEIRLLADTAPGRIDTIRELESAMGELRRARNIIEPDRYAHPDAATFFQTRNGRRIKVCTMVDAEGHDCTPAIGEEWGPTCVVKRKLVDSTPMHIDDIVAWARTDHGGKQTVLFAPTPTGGCMRWGLCETAPGKGDE